MKRVLALIFAFTLVAGQLFSIAQTTGVGVITGTVSGPSGPMVGATVQVLDSAGAVVGTATTTEAGAFSVTGLSAGTFTVQTVGINGAILGATNATLAAGSMSVAVTLSATAGALAASAVAVTAVAHGAAFSSTTVLAAVGAAAAAAGTAAVIASKPNASGSH
jgi:carboxypeptidase family protein